RVQTAIHAQTHIGRQRLASGVLIREQMAAETGGGIASNRCAKMLNQKPIRPMGMFARSRIVGEEFREAAGPGRRLAQLPPALEYRALHQTVRPTENRQRAEHALAQEHSPKKFYRRKKHSAQARRYGNSLRNDRRLKMGGIRYGERARHGCGQRRPRRWHSSRVRWLCRVRRGSARGRTEQQPRRLRSRCALIARSLGIHAMASSRTRCSPNSALKPMSWPMVAATWLWSTRLSTTAPRF